MPIDLAALAEHRSFEDRRAGIRERFLAPSIGGAATTAILSEPLAEPAPMGWVVCHSFWIEQINLGWFDAQLARGLAAAGFPVLRYHGQGYGDSDRGVEEIGVGSHLGDAIDADRVLRQETGIAVVGFAGARFGGTVAAMAADRSMAAAVAMLQPAVRGRAYVRSLERNLYLEQMPTKGGGGPDAAEGADDGETFVLQRESVKEVSALGLLDELRSFQGSSLVLQVSRTSEPQADLKGLVDHLGSLGGRVCFEVVEDQE
ncbi:MAG TPA: hypothetical protein VF984_06550, partial [Actinomycetota bacterium]